MHYSVIIPVYNRPDEIEELLKSLTEQTYKDFDVLVIEDGSSDTCEEIVNSYSEKLEIQYFFKENSGQGFSRNYGFERAGGDYFVVFDSDCLIPPHYFQVVDQFLQKNPVDCWGGPDRAHPSFTLLQKAINYSMTSFLTTGGIRGKKNRIGTFHPRSFNMGISREVFEQTGGYKITRMGEDIEFSIRILRSGFKSSFVEDAYVFHKRRTSLLQFYKQLHFFGRARVNVNSMFPGEIKAVHLFPFLFLAGLAISFPLSFSGLPLFSALIFLYPLYAFLLFADAFFKEKNVQVAFLATIAGFIQLTAYGAGFITEFFNRSLQKR
ncbi:MAG: glycosyltransferase [Balneolaceae bacterium]